MSAITFHCRPANTSEQETTVRHLKAHTEATIGIQVTHEPFALLAYDGNTMIGSVIGKIFFSWLHIDLIWVDPGHQRRGIGSSLMHKAEKYIKEHNLQGIEVWTQSWQAPEFYRKLGYQEFAIIDDFTPGRKRHAFRYLCTKAPQ